MTFHIVTIFPEVLKPYSDESILGIAQKNKKIKIKYYDLRDFTKNKHGKVDDKIYGPGPGMVLTLDPLVRAITKITRGKDPKTTKIILTSAGGKEFNNKRAKTLTKYKNIILIAGRYEGVDARLQKIFSGPASGGKIEELSIGPYVLTGGELPAIVIVDAVARQIPGVLGKEDSIEESREGIGVPVYTRPETYSHKGKNYKVPKILLSGDHKKISNWRTKNKKSS